MRFNSALPDIRWPAYPDEPAARLMAGLYQLEHSQWQSPDKLRQRQFEQLAPLLEHAAMHVPFYRERLRAGGWELTPGLDAQRWSQIPLLTRADIQRASAALMSNAPPPSHGGHHVAQTSGSTGEPVKVTKTQVCQYFWQLCTLRNHFWHRRDFQGRFAAIRVFAAGAAAPDGETFSGWSRATSRLFSSGQSMRLDLRTDIAVQARWLERHNPKYLLTFPSNLHGLIEYFEHADVRLPALSEVIMVGEIVSPALRADCRRVLGVPLTDTYSSEEFGYLALQCPDHAHYHVQSENVLVEVLDDDGRPCAPGAVGRLVVSSLHNFAMPLIRYEIGDLAEVGEPCACGRGLPVLKRIIGRVRNLVRLPTGERRLPIVGYRGFRDIAPVRQYQFIQRTLEQIEVRLAVERPLTGDEEARLRVHIQQSLDYPFLIAFVYMPTIPRTKAGKFEEFMCAIPG